MEQFPHKRRIALYSAAGDRRDEDMVKQGEMLSHAFDTVLIYEDQYIRGREPGDITRLIRQGMSGSRVKEIHEIRSTRGAEACLSLVQPGDLVLLQADTIDDTINFINEKFVVPQHAREIKLRDAVPEAEQSTAAHTPARNTTHRLCRLPLPLRPMGTDITVCKKSGELAQVVD